MASCACSYYCGPSDACIEVPLGGASSSHLPRLVEIGIGAQLIPAAGQLCVIIDAFDLLQLFYVSFRTDAVHVRLRQEEVLLSMWSRLSRSLNRRCFRSWIVLYPIQAV